MTDKEWHEQLIAKYPKVKPEILRTYKQPEKFIVVNAGDRDLTPFKVPMPDPPPLHKIDGWGLPAKEQKFQYQVIPRSLIMLEKEQGNVTSKEEQNIPIVDRIWNIIEEQQENYQEELDFIRLQIKRRFKGYWCFINGRPTFMDGWNYVYLNFWKFKNGWKPEYRDRHRRAFHAVRYCYTTTSIPLKDEYSRFVVDEDGFIKEKDIGERTCFGHTEPKNRRNGSTNMALCISYLETMTKFGVISGIMSMDGDSAYKHYMDILVPGWRRMPFFFKPVTAGNNNPEKGLYFNRPPRRNIAIDPDSELGSIMNYAETAQSSFYDGDKVFFILMDEQGKVRLADVATNWQRIRNCLAQGNGAVIEGFAMLPSTVGEMKDGGGRQFQNLCKQSHWHERNANGRTQSGLINIFFKAEDGLEGFVDEYGNSVIETPEKPVKGYKNGREIWITKGSREHLKNERQAFLDAGDMEGYLEQCRLFPQEFREAFAEEGDDIGINLKIVQERLNYLVLNPPKNMRRGNLEWENDVIDSKVVWKDDPMGRFELYFMPHPHDQSRKYYKDGMWYPENPDKFIGSSDPFRVAKTKGKGTGSKGGGAVFRCRDMTIDPDSKDISSWLTHNIALTYKFRAKDPDEFCEDMLKKAVFFGAMEYPEYNVNIVGPHFIRRGYGGYLLYDTDPATGQPSPTAGFNTMGGVGGSNQRIFGAIISFIENHGYRVDSIEFLKECEEIKGTDELTKFDLFVAIAGCLLGTKSKWPDYIQDLQPAEGALKEEDWFPEHYQDD